MILPTNYSKGKKRANKRHFEACSLFKITLGNQKGEISFTYLRYTCYLIMNENVEERVNLINFFMRAFLWTLAE